MTDLALHLGVALVAGLVSRHGVLHLGAALAARTTVRVPLLCGYALAGTIAGALKLVMLEWMTLPTLLAWAAFGVAWGVCAGLVLPLARRRQPVR